MEKEMETLETKTLAVENKWDEMDYEYLKEVDELKKELSLTHLSHWLNIIYNFRKFKY